MGSPLAQDGRRLLFSRGIPADEEIYLVDSQVAPNVINQLEISKDNRWIYFSMTVAESDIWFADDHHHISVTHHVQLFGRTRTTSSPPVSGSAVWLEIARHTNPMAAATVQQVSETSRRTHAVLSSGRALNDFAQ